MVVIRLSSVVCCLLDHELVERRSCTHTLYTGDIHASGKGGKVGLATGAGIEDELAILTIDANDTGDVATEVDFLGIGINISLGRSQAEGKPVGFRRFSRRDACSVIRAEQF